jgi:uncharacterized protein (DUF362 family)
LQEEITRREFFKRAAVTGTAIAGLSFLEKVTYGVPEVPAGKSRVVVARNQALLAGDGVDQKVAERMLGQAMAKLVGANSGAQAWKTLFKPTDVVGIKVNCLCGKGASTHPEIAYAVVAGLKMAGVPEGNIIIWDRSSGDLAKSGYTLNKGEGVRVLADDGDWGEAVRSGSISGRLSKIITEKITALVNVPILKTHGIPGLTCALKNHYGSFDNPGAAHGDGCNPYLADLNALPQIKNKTRLIVVDAARPQCDGGPGLQADAQFDYHGILVSKDPLAADRVGLEIINERRKQTGRRELSVESLKWFASSARAGVGVCDLSNIELVNI